MTGSGESGIKWWRRLRLAGLVLVALVSLALAARNGEEVPGPVPARVLKAVDGDTLEVEATIWLGQEVHILVRIRGIDAPELRARCAEEARLAAAARDRLAQLTNAGPVGLLNVRRDKYGGRVSARVTGPDGADLGAAMVAAGLARLYHGGRRQGWCGAAGD